MSAICGVLSLSGDSDCKDDFASMMRILEYRGIAGAEVLREKNLSFGKQKSSFSSDSGIISDDELVIVADARIDNRKDLFRQLEFPQSDQNLISDSQIILASYKRWGSDCPKFLIGAFSFAIWEKKNQRLFCCRDHLGISPFFYFQNSRKFIFASESKAILAASGVENKINQNRLATMVIPQAKFLFNEESWFKGIRIFPAGKSLTIDKTGIKQAYFWQPKLENKLPFKNEGEIIEALRELIFEVVGATLESDFPVSALLSGGLDSSAIVSVAAKILEKENKSLQTFSAVLPDENDDVLTDERFFINQFRDFPNIKLNYVTAPGGNPFENLEETIWRADSPLLTSRHYLYAAFNKLAESSGSRTILDGGGGELSVTFHGEGCYAEMFSHFRWLKLWRELDLRRKLTGEAIRYNLRFNVLNLFLGKEKQEPSISNDHPFHQKIADKFIADILPKFADFTLSSNDASPNHKINHRNMLSNLQRKSPGHIGGIGTENVELRTPLMDIRLIEFCQAMPYDLQVRNGFKRYLVRIGLDKILPPQIQWRNTKDAFSPDYLRRYNASQKWVQDFLAEINPPDPLCEIIDVEKLKGWANVKIDDDEKDISKEVIARDLLPQSIYLIYFLRRFSEFQN